MNSSTFRKALCCFFSAAGKATPVSVQIAAFHPLLLGESVTATLVMLFIHPNSDLEMMTHCVERGLSVCAQTQQ